MAAEFYTPKEVSERLGLSETAIQAACKDGRIQAEKRRVHLRVGYAISAAEIERITPILDTLFSRSHGQRQHIPCPVSPGRLEEIYYDSLSLREAARRISEIAGREISPKTVARWMEQFDIPRRTLKAAAAMRARTSAGRRHIKEMAKKIGEKIRAGGYSTDSVANLNSPRVKRKAQATKRAHLQERLVDLTCSMCGRAFKVKPGRIAARERQAGKGAPIYCSRPCGVKGGHMERKRRKRAGVEAAAGWIEEALQQVRDEGGRA